MLEILRTGFSRSINAACSGMLVQGGFIPRFCCMEEKLDGHYGNNDSDNCRRYSSGGSAIRFLYYTSFVNKFM